MLRAGYFTTNTIGPEFIDNGKPFAPPSFLDQPGLYKILCFYLNKIGPGWKKKKVKSKTLLNCRNDSFKL
jgi:hypothetical protein